jgi:hypothetical protein
MGAVTACTPFAATTSSDPGASHTTTPTAPARPDLTSPESAVRSYLEWVAFSYRMTDSDLATPTMGPTETVRVDSYIQLNRQAGRGIDERLLTFRTTRVVRNGPDSATVSTYEEWEYRYFDVTDPSRSLSPLHRATYDAVYTAVRGSDGSWRVEKVDATPRGKVE